MNRIHEGLADQEFTMPSSIEKLSVCAETGLLPRAGCPVITEYFDIGDVPDEYCDNHFYEPEPIPEYTEDTYYEEPSTDTETTTDTIIRMEKHLLPKIPALRILVQAILAPVILVPAVMVPAVTVPETATGTMWIPAPAATLPGAATGIMWIPAPAVMFL